MLCWLSQFCTSLTNSKHRAGIPVSRFESTRTTAVFSLASYAELVAASGSMLSDDERLAICGHGKLFLRCNQWLAAESLSQGKCLFKIRPKHHGFHHIVLAVQGGCCESPRTHEVWGEETLGGAVSGLTRKCHSRTCMSRAVERFLGQLVGDIAGFEPVQWLD